MSSMRNAVQRRNHKERAQPEERKKWGLLEKRKDYKLRAADHKAKLARLKILKEKAAERNPDEFSFGMVSSRVDSDGRKIAERGNKALTMDVVKLLKTQDAGYIRTMLQVVRKEREELEKRVILGEEELRVLRDGENGKKGKRTVYVGKKEEQDAFDKDDWLGRGSRNVRDSSMNGDSLQHEDEDDDGEEEEDVVAPAPKQLSKKQQEALHIKEKQEKAFFKKRSRAHQRAAQHLTALKARERDLMTAEEELETQRAKMNNTIGGVNKDGVKFKIRERKR